MIVYHHFLGYFLKISVTQRFMIFFFYWCDDEQRMSLEKKYNLSFIYEKYACG
ncbi:DUF3965 domain-containing protein [Bacillus cereus]